MSDFPIDVNSPYKMEFFKDFTGSVGEFKELLRKLANGTADPNLYGNPQEQLALLAHIQSGVTAIHPNRSIDSLARRDLGEYLYINGRYYKMGVDQPHTGMYWAEWQYTNRDQN